LLVSEPGVRHEGCRQRVHRVGYLVDVGAAVAVRIQPIEESVAKQGFDREERDLAGCGRALPDGSSLGAPISFCEIKVGVDLIRHLL